MCAYYFNFGVMLDFFDAHVRDVVKMNQLKAIHHGSKNEGVVAFLPFVLFCLVSPAALIYHLHCEVNFGDTRLDQMDRLIISLKI